MGPAESPPGMWGCVRNESGGERCPRRGGSSRREVVGFIVCSRPYVPAGRQQEVEKPD